MSEKEKDKAPEIKSSLGSFNFNTLTKEEALEKFEKVLAQREKQIEDLSQVIGNYNDKLMSALERVKNLENENEILKEKLLRKEKLLEQELENKEIMFIRMQSLENEIDQLMQKKQKESKKGPIDSFFGMFSSNKKEEKREEPPKRSQNNNFSNNTPLISKQSSLDQSQPSQNISPNYTKTSSQVTSNTSNPITNVTPNPTVETVVTPTNNTTQPIQPETKSVNVLDKMKALKKKNTEKIVSNPTQLQSENEVQKVQQEEKKEENNK